MTIEAQLHAEINLINRTLAAFAIDAGTRPGWTVVAGTSYIAYGLRTGRSQPIDAIERRLPELAERISARRGQRTPVRLRRLPLALEVTHPAPQPLDWRGAVLRVGGARILAGRNYSAQPTADCIIDLAERPHVLIAGTTGSGKSTMLRTALASLCYSTAPDTLRLALVDLKNEDLVPFAPLPHVSAVAWTAGEARNVVRTVAAELRRRVEAGTGDWQRVVLVIDELAQLDPDSIEALGSVLAVGRSKAINVIAATQHPAVRLIGDKANYSVRLVGQVADAQTAALATGRKNTGAEVLPGAGAFLHIDGPDVHRIQAYYLPADPVPELVRTIAQKWPAVPEVAPVRTSATTPAETPAAAPASVPAPVRTSVEFPLPNRAPTAEEAAAIRQLYAELGSKNQTVIAVYGAKSSSRWTWISEALADPEPQPGAAIIKMRRA